MTDRPSEFALIAGVFAPLAQSPGALGLKDDAALLAPRPGCDLIVTTDALVAGMHFLQNDPAEAVGRKALRVNLSDLACKGAEPSGYLLALSLPDEVTLEWLEAFAAGLGDDQKTYDVGLLGGDTTRTDGPLTLAITAFGHVPKGAMIPRSGARPGEHVFVSGTVGDAVGGLALLTGEDRTSSKSQAAELIGRYRLPEPRLRLGKALRGVATAALDVSDGLIADLAHIADASGVRIVLEAERIPLSLPLRALWGASPDAVVRAATGGDDYEIAFTAATEELVLKAATRAQVRVTRIGRVEAGAGVALLDSNGCEIPVARQGFTHF